ncbi:MAG: hypothetical protein ACWIPH_08320, partial [Ostreibacterium sp.]
MNKPTKPMAHQPTSEESQPQIKYKARRFRKLLKIVLIAGVVLVMLLFIVGYYFFNTTAGLKQAINLVNRYSDYQVKVDSIQGELLNKVVLKHLRIKGKNIGFNGELVVLDWQSRALFDKSIIVKSVEIKNATLKLSSSVGNENKLDKKQQSITLNDIELPFDISLENVLVENLTLENPVTSKADFVIERLQLGINYIDQIIKINTFIFKGEGIDLNLTGQLETRGDFTLHLANKIQYTSTVYGDEIVDINIDGALKKALTLQMEGTGVSNFQLSGQLYSALQSPKFNAHLSLQKMDMSLLGIDDAAINAEIDVKGYYHQRLNLSTIVRATYYSPQTDKLKLTLNAGFDGNRIDLSKMRIDLLTAKQQLTGKGHYNVADKTVNLQLYSDVLHWPQATEIPSFVAKKILLKVTGKTDNYQVKASTDIETKSLDTLPLTLVAYGNERAFRDIKLLAKINQQPLEIAGKVTWSPTVSYDVNIKATDIKPFKQLPGI